jgi:isopentenyl phosphate kinase
LNEKLLFSRTKLKLNSIEQKLPGDSILFCMDVKGLYPSVPKQEGLDACDCQEIAQVTVVPIHLSMY